MACVFISYRRRDNPYVAGILRDALQAHFGIDQVFFDLDKIPYGVDFRQYIANAVGSCVVLLVVIGDQWLHLHDEKGRRRLEDPSDFVRIEIEAALKRDITVVPVLIESAQMPAASELPESIREMAFRNAAEIRAGRDQKHQVDRLVSDLAASLKEKIFGLKVVKAFEGVVMPIPGLYFSRWIPELSPRIPEAKVRAAIQSCAPNVEPDEVMLLWDGFGMTGEMPPDLILTLDSIYGNELGYEHWRFCYSEIRHVEVRQPFFEYIGDGKTYRGLEVVINGSFKINIAVAEAKTFADAMVKLLNQLKP